MATSSGIAIQDEMMAFADDYSAEDISSAASNQRKNRSRRPTTKTSGCSTSASSLTAPPPLTAASAMVHALFGSDDDKWGPCWGDFECSHARIPGRLYAVTSGLLFYSNFLGFERRLCLRFPDVCSLELHRTTSLRIELQKAPTNHHEAESQHTTATDSATTDCYIFRSFVKREQVLQLLVGLKRLADERLSCKPRPITMRTQSERFATRELTVSFDENIDGPVGPGRDEDSRDSKVAQTPNRTASSSYHLGDSFSISPTPPRLQRSVMSDNHLEAAEQYPRLPANSFSPPMTWNRRRAVSDTLVRFLGLDGDDRVVPPTERDQWLDTLDATPSTCTTITTATTSAPTMQITTDPVKEAWEAAIVHANELEDIGIDSLHLPCTLDTFYRTFLADGAPFSFERFQREHIRDHNVVVTPWEPSATNDKNVSHQIRTLSFTHPIKRNVGPTEAHTRRRQAVRRFGIYGITFTNTTHVDGIPAADCFAVHDFWTITPVVDEDAIHQHTAITVSVRFAPRFTKRTLFRSVIERNIKRETKEWGAHFETMARAALQQDVELKLNESSERSGLSSVLPQQDDSVALANVRSGMKQEHFFLSSPWYALYLVLVLVLMIVALVLVVLILQLLQTREALSIVQQDIAALRLANHQLLQQQWTLITAQQHHQQQQRQV